MCDGGFALDWSEPIGSLFSSGFCIGPVLESSARSTRRLPPVFFRFFFSIHRYLMLTIARGRIGLGGCVLIAIVDSLSASFVRNMIKHYLIRTQDS